jgi:hypothetical protein
MKTMSLLTKPYLPAAIMLDRPVEQMIARARRG